MDTKVENEEKKEYLNRYRIASRKIKSLQEQRESLMIEKRNAKAIQYSDMPHGNKQSDLSDYIAALDSLEERIGESIRERMKARVDIEKGIIYVRDGIESDILRKRYIELKSWECICNEIGYSWKETHRKHGKALQDFKIMT
ncbi:hypothetical protein lbkm_0668 [Lachnospiraceae bacterium KM106-2]|nr:hypothetical protein lbkm_0668 [Lachnospiraceae bacterium KM106-2]